MYFNPLTAARQVIAETDLASPEDIARRVFEMTPRDQMARAYIYCLRHVCRNAIRSVRTTGEWDTSPASVKPDPAPAPARPSAKVAAIRKAHVSYYERRVYAQGEWKMLGDCTLADVRDLAAQAQSKADANARRAAEWTALADRMERVGAATVRDADTEMEATA